MYTITTYIKLYTYEYTYESMYWGNVVLTNETSENRNAYTYKRNYIFNFNY